jgi:hypothetical protein
MKRLLLLLTGILFANSIIALDKSGAIPTETWSGTINVTGTVTVGDGVVLTISAGTTVLFNSSTSLVIQGTGIIHANGTSGSKIIFTRNGTATWENIRFLATSTGSNLTHCNISYGNGYDLGFGVVGGGLYIGGSGLTVDNCDISNCLAIAGGGIEIDQCSPKIYTSRIHDNSNEGIEIYEGNPEINNCIIYKNSSTGYGGGLSISGDPDIINCMIIENTTSSNSRNPVPYGGLFASGSNPHIVNTIFWNNKKGSTIGYDCNTSNLVTCALVQSKPGQLLLSTNNLDATGPNFTDPATYNYAITFLSPCRDAGTTTYSGVAIPGTDIMNNGTIGIKDIGSYEVQYSRWKGTSSTTWTISGNWESGLVPSTSSNVIIPVGCTYYPIVTSYTISATGSITIEAGATATIRSLTNNGKLTIKSDASSTSSLINTINYTGSGQTKVDLFLKGGVSATGPRWHWIAAPFQVQKTLFTTNPATDNLLKYVDSKVTTSINDGWNWHDNYGGSTPFTTIDTWVGYNVYYTTDLTKTYDGTAIEWPGATKSIPLAFSGTDVNLYGWNLIGNSYLCSLDWDQFDMTNAGSVHNAIYFSKDNMVASYVDYVSVNGGSNIIPPLQGFFVKTDAASQIIDIPTYAVLANSAPRYKGLNLEPSEKVTEEIKLVRININKEGFTDESVIRLKDEATDGFDKNYDALKFFAPVSTVPQLYSNLFNKKYAINSIAPPETVSNIPVSLSVPSAGDYKINCTEITGIGNYKVLLKDNMTQSVIDLNSIKSYNFNVTAAGTIDNRFIISISNITTDINLPISKSKEFKIYNQNDLLNIVPLTEEWDGKKGDIKILNISGNTVAIRTGVVFSREIPETFNINFPDGIYFVNITSSIRNYTGKVNIIRR